jgi:5-methylcytosine-specific restriction endonuclease McrA
MVKKNIRKMNRSGSQSCPVCDKTVPLVEHHIHGREVRRWNEDWNIVWLCATCHDLVHLYEVIIEGWYNVDGRRKLVWRNKDESPIIDDGAKPPKY